MIDAYEKREGRDFRLNEPQRAAVRVVADNDFAAVTGNAGVGETTALKCVYDAFEYQDFEIIQVALAGKAARRMTGATGRPAMTIAGFILLMRKRPEQAARDRPI